MECFKCLVNQPLKISGNETGIDLVLEPVSQQLIIDQGREMTHTFKKCDETVPTLGKCSLHEVLTALSTLLSVNPTKGNRPTRPLSTLFRLPSVRKLEHRPYFSLIFSLMDTPFFLILCYVSLHA